jgi:surface polysaccharide O-acyltransferase-like enzyme
MAAIFLLLFFANLKISNFWKRIIGCLSPMAFGVYLIHIHPLVLFGIFKDGFTEYASLPWVLEILAVLGMAAVIYLICSLIDFIRLQIFKALHIRRKLDSFEEYIKVKIRGVLWHRV